MHHRLKDPFVERVEHDGGEHVCELMDPVEFRAWAARRRLTWEEACRRHPETAEIAPGVVMHVVTVKVAAPTTHVWARASS